MKKKARLLLAENLAGLLHKRRLKQKDLADYCHHSEMWISAVLAAKQDVKSKDLDRIASFFGYDVYQLFQPGITRNSERRIQERRGGQDRRIGHGRAAMFEEAASESAGHIGKGQTHGTAPLPPIVVARRRLIEDFERRLHSLLSHEDAGGQAPAPRARQSKARARRRVSGGSDAPKD